MMALGLNMIIALKNWKYIIKHENLEFLRQTNLLQYMANPSILDGKKERVNRPDELSSHDITVKYLSVLSNEDILALYKAYEMDFKLFDYTFTIGNLTVP